MSSFRSFLTVNGQGDSLHHVYSDNGYSRKKHVAATHALGQRCRG